MVNVDLTTFTEVDNGADLTVTIAKVDVLNQAGNVENYVYVDRGAAYYSGDFDHDFEHYVSVVNNTAAGAFIGVSDQIGTMQAGPSFFTAINSVGLLPYLIEVNIAGNLDLIVAGSALTIDTLYYSTFKRVGNTLTWDIYTDSDRTSLHQSLTGTIVNTSQTFQYFYAQSAYNVSDANTASYYVQNVDYKEATIITGSGSHQATTAQSNGTAERSITGLGAGQVDTATSSGTAERVVTGSGSHQANVSISSGIGERSIVGPGNNQATFATSTGVALRVITGSGSHEADVATSYGVSEDGLISIESYKFDVSINKLIRYSPITITNKPILHNVSIVKKVSKEIRL